MDPSKPVMVAGDPERKNEKMSEEDGGITYHHSIIDAMVTVLPCGVFDPVVTMVIVAGPVSQDYKCSTDEQNNKTNIKC